MRFWVNRAVLNTDAEQSLLLIDVVRFSDVSTNSGYDYGDKVLLEIANWIVFLFNHSAKFGQVGGHVPHPVIDINHHFLTTHPMQMYA